MRIIHLITFLSLIMLGCGQTEEADVNMLGQSISEIEQEENVKISYQDNGASDFASIHLQINTTSNNDPLLASRIALKCFEKLVENKIHYVTIDTEIGKDFQSHDVVVLERIAELKKLSLNYLNSLGEAAESDTLKEKEIDTNYMDAASYIKARDLIAKHLENPYFLGFTIGNVGEKKVVQLSFKINQKDVCYLVYKLNEGEGILGMGMNP